MARAHLYLPLEDEQGNLFSYAQVEIRNASGGLIPDPLYKDPTTGSTITNPATLVPAVLDVWIDTPQRVDVIIHPGKRDPITIKGIDVVPPAEEQVRTVSQVIEVLGTGSPGDPLIYAGGGTAVFSPAATGKHVHDGEGRLSTDVSDINTGVNRALGDDSTVLGQLSTAYGDSTVVGTSSGPSSGTPTKSTIIGKGSTANTQGVTIGEALSSTGVGSTHVAWPGSAAGGIQEAVLGKNSGAGSSDHSTLIGSAQAISDVSDVTRIGEGHGAGAGSGSVEVGAGNASLQVIQPGSVSGSTQGIALGIPMSFTDVWGATSVNRPVGLDHGRNDPTYQPAIAALQAASTVASAGLAAGGDTTVGWHPYGTLTSSLLSFFGHVGAAKTHQTDNASIPALTSLISALAQMGIVWDKATPILSDTFVRPDLSEVGYAESGQAGEWWADSGRNDAIGITSTKAQAVGTAPDPGAVRVYETRQSDVTVTGTFGYVISAASPPKANAEYIGLLVRCAHSTGLNGYMAGRLGLYKITNYALTSLGTYSTAPVSGDTLSVEAHGTTLNVKVNGTSVLSVTDSTYQNQFKHGFILSGSSTCSLLRVFPWT